MIMTKMNLLRRAFLCLLSFVCACGLKAQDQSPVQIFSPNAAELGKYGQVPVSYFNGLPQITVPLTTFKAKGYELPIYLSYYAGGNKPDAHPGWVGQGWSLHAGGMINRIVNGWKDEKAQSEFQQAGSGSANEQGYLKNVNEFQSNNSWMQESFLGELFFRNYIYDTDPDEFQINIDDIQASFYISGTNQVKIKSQSSANFTVDFKIDQLESNTDSRYILWRAPHSIHTPSLGTNVASAYIKEITITKDNGTKYVFGGDLNSIDFNLNWYGIGDNWKVGATPITWWLKRIELTNGESIGFEYEKDGVPIIMIDQHSRALCSGGDEDKPFDTRTNPNLYKNISFSFIKPSYLSKIKSVVAQDSISFARGRSNELTYDITKRAFEKRMDIDIQPAAHIKDYTFELFMESNYYAQLNEITLHNRNKIRFGYTDSDQTRLKLLSVSFCDKEGKRANSYSFEYNPLELPRYNSKRTDRWGYYNNKYYGNQDYKDLNVYRTASPTYMKAEMLQKIIYPTGGYSTFEYEPHQYSRVVDQQSFTLSPENGIGGGLRIKKIIDNDGIKDTFRSFEYVNQENQSSGILAGLPIYKAEGTVRVFYCSKDWSMGAYLHLHIDSDLNYYFAKEGYCNQLSTTNGDLVTYDRVVEQKEDGSKAVYNYFNHADAMDDGVVVINNFDNQILVDCITSKELERGLLKQMEYIDAQGNCIQTDQYMYNNGPGKYTEYVKAIKFTRPFPEELQCGLSQLTAYKIYTFFPFLRYKKTIIQEPGKPQIATGTEYRYNANRQLIETLKTHNNGEEERVTSSYSGNILGGIYKEMKQKNMLSSLVEKIKTRNGAVVDAQLFTYKKNENNGDFVLDQMFQAEISEPIPSNKFIRFNGTTKDSHYKAVKIKYEEYDSNSNIERFVDKEIGNTTCKWSSNSMYPTAIFENAQNSYKRQPVYKSIYKAQEINLSGVNNNDIKTYHFTTSKREAFKLYFSFGTRSKWYIEGRVDGLDFQIVGIFSPDNTGGEWSFYSRADRDVQIILNAGPHTLSIYKVVLYSEHPSYSGQLTYEYCGQKDTGLVNIVPEREDAFYQDFEDASANANVSFGFHSERSYKGAYTVNLYTSPSREYFIDYQVYKNGQWKYMKKDFLNGTHTINEGTNPIDEVRVYPKDGKVTSFTYFPLMGMRSRTDERGITESYEYDAFGRLIKVNDTDLNPTSLFEYNYAIPAVSNN
jgi:YD repeat-containing protein